ncbi:MAG: hypothetical protein GW946_01700 [Candidatus Pacebacteria bacterium]|nr:hypothetical protein [Candidatus Paceibacterota bacterium]PIR60464.1 MAG: hypothetical protein COU67_01675 [Candidatus Pacebacteria bacterium CG10_big_fil_rev_8_21_14_0_10_44_54]
MQKAPSRLQQPKQFKKSAYLKTLPFGLFSLVGLGGLYYLLTNISPQQIAHVPLPNMYGPFLLLIFLSIFFLLGYALNNTRRGFVAASSISLLIFLHLQHIVINKYVVGAIAILFLITEVLAKRTHREQKVT